MSGPVRLTDLEPVARGIVAAGLAAERAAAVRDGSDNIRPDVDLAPVRARVPVGGRASGATPPGPPRRRSKAAA